MAELLGGATIELAIDDSKLRQGLRLNGDRVRRFARDARGRFTSVGSAASEAAERVSRSWRQASGSVGAARGRLDATGRAARSASGALQQVGAAMQRGSVSATLLSAAMGSVVSALAGFFAIRRVAGLLADAARESAEFGKQLAFVATMLDQTTRPLLGRFALALTDFSARFGEDTKTLSRGLFDVLSASIDARDAVDFLRVGVESARGGFTDTAVTIDALTTLVNAYGLAASDAGTVSDQLFATVKRGKTTFGELASQIGQVAAIAASLNVPLTEVGAAIATMTRSGLSTADAVTSLRSILVQILRPTDEFEEASKRLGITIDAAKLRSEGLTGVLRELAALGPTAAGALFRRVEAIRGLAILLPNLQAFVEDVNTVADSAGRRQEALAEALNTTATRWAQVGQQIRNIARQGGPLDAASQKLAQIASGLVRALDEAFFERAGAAGTLSPQLNAREELITRGGAIAVSRGLVSRRELERLRFERESLERLGVTKPGERMLTGLAIGSPLLQQLILRARVFERFIALAREEDQRREKPERERRAAEQRAVRQRAQAEAERIEQARQASDIEKQLLETTTSTTGELQRAAQVQNARLEAAQALARGDADAARAITIRAAAEREITELQTRRKEALEEVAQLRDKLRLVSESDRRRLADEIAERMRMIEREFDQQIELIRKRRDEEIRAITETARRRREAEQRRERVTTARQAVSEALQLTMTRFRSALSNLVRSFREEFSFARLSPEILGTVQLSGAVIAPAPGRNEVLEETKRQVTLQRQTRDRVQKLVDIMSRGIVV